MQTYGLTEATPSLSIAVIKNIVEYLNHILGSCIISIYDRNHMQLRKIVATDFKAIPHLWQYYSPRHQQQLLGFWLRLRDHSVVVACSVVQ